VTTMPLWAQSPYLLRWMKLLLECGLVEDGPEAEAVFRRSPFYPPPNPPPPDEEILAWARHDLRQARSQGEVT